MKALDGRAGKWPAARRGPIVASTVDLPYTIYGAAASPADTGSGFTVRSPPVQSPGAGEPSTADASWKNFIELDESHRKGQAP